MWCQFSRLNYSSQELRRISSKEKNLLNFVQRVFELQQTLGGIVAVENPRTSDIWRQPQFDSIVKEENVCFADLDLCQYGLVSVADGKPLKKGVSILTNNQVFAKELALRCPGQHEHRPIQGKDTRASATYPPDFAKAVVKALDGACRAEARTSTHFPTSTEPGTGEVEPTRGAEAIYFKGKVKPMVASTLKRIHQNLGHPPTRELIRHLKLGGASESVIRAAEQMVCRTCNKSAKAKSSRPASPAVVLDFNEVVAADIIWLDTMDSTRNPALNIVDVASTYQVVLPLSNTTSEEVGRAMVEGWMSWAGARKHLIVDLDSAFKDSFLQVMNERAVILQWRSMERNLEQVS